MKNKKTLTDFYAFFLYEDVNEIKLFLRVFLTDKTGRHLNKGLIEKKVTIKKN